jgi:hypothetical protein
MSTARETDDAEREKHLEHRVAVREEPDDATAEDRRDGALIDEAWRHQAGRPLIDVHELKRRLGLE